jgi:hypothetical protein
MHVLHRPHPLRLVGVSIAAAILALAISLALARSMGNISQPSDNTGTPAHHGAPALTTMLETNVLRSAGDPSASLLSRPLPQPWLTARP